MSDCVKGFGCRPLKDRGHKQGGRRPKIFKGDANKLPTAIVSSHVLSQWPKGKWTRKQNLQSNEACDCSPFARPASFAQLAIDAYTPPLAVETIPSPFYSRADILPLTMDRFAPEPAIRAWLRSVIVVAAHASNPGHATISNCYFRRSLSVALR